jgi:hypothetical protein
MCFVFIREQTATCATYSINWLVFITETKSVHSAVWNGSLKKKQSAHRLQTVNIITETVEKYSKTKFYENSFTKASQRHLQKGLHEWLYINLALSPDPLSPASAISSAINNLGQSFSTAGSQPGTGSWHQIYRDARGSPGICHFIFLSIFHE